MKFLLCFLILGLFVSSELMSEETKQSKEAKEVPENAESIILGAGCFWCTEAVYEQIDGVVSVESGYSGGTVADPTYRAVTSGTTGHAEVVKVVFDPDVVSLAQVLEWFWKMHDPTILNRQGGDVGTQYRSAIFYSNDEQKRIAEASMKAAAENFDDPIVTEITKAGTFYPAEGYHQDYYFENRSAGYCQMVIAPKLKKLDLEE